jgi:hypothetical protein
MTQFLKDKNNTLSLRELVSLLAFVACVVMWVAHQFFAKAIEEFIFFGFLGVVTAGIFGYSIEKFSGPKNPNANAV